MRYVDSFMLVDTGTKTIELKVPCEDVEELRKAVAALWAKNASFREHASPFAADGQCVDEWSIYLFSKQLYVSPQQVEISRREELLECPSCKSHALLYECIACSSNNYPPPMKEEVCEQPWL